MVEKAVLVIGGGIAGIQASLDLGSAGVKVYLVEKYPSIGGKMAQLDKTFPTNDCSMCILAPKMVDVFYNENVTIHSYTEVKSIEGEAGDFEVTLTKKSRYVNEDKCTGCELCTQKCPKKLPDEYNMELNKRKAIYVPFPQAVPRVALIDPENCIYLEKGKCQACLKVCQSGAIDFDMKDEEIKVKVGSVIIATGFEPYDPYDMREYGYGRYANVLTAMEYERLINASGPTGGHLDRRSDDHRVPDRLTFIQCVGSRAIKHNRPYCSSVCCMHATKEAILAREHYPNISTTIFFTDIRPPGKGFHEYTERAQKEYGVDYIRAKPGEIIEDRETKNLRISYLDPETSTVKEHEADMVVLSTALVPSESTKDLAKRLNVELDQYGFVKNPNPLVPVETSVPGIFTCGYCQSPKDIPESVAQASGAAASAMRVVLGKEGV